MTKPKTNILTFSKLAKWAASLARNDIDTYTMMAREGVELTRFDRHRSANGWMVGITIDAVQCRFELSNNNNKCGSTQFIYGRVCGGKLYSMYKYTFKVSEFSGQFWTRYLPMVPQAKFVPSRFHHQSKPNQVVIRNADGSHGRDCHWLTYQAGRNGSSNNPIVLCDSDGGSVLNDVDVLARVTGSSETNEASLGWFPYAASEPEVMESISVYRQHADHEKMRALLKRTIAAAQSMLRDDKRKKMALFPAIPRTGPYPTPRDTRHGMDMTVLHRLVTSNYPEANITPPEVFVYWKEERTGWTYLQMLIPPVGNSSLSIGNKGDVVTTNRGPYQKPYGSFETVLAKDPDKEESCSYNDVANGITKYLFDFSKSADHVICMLRKGGDYNTWQMPRVARQPEDMAHMLVESALMASLPLA